MEYFDPFVPRFWRTTGLAVARGGVERQLRGKPPGARASILICLSTALFVHLGAAVAGPESDPTRILGQLVTGVGFLGAGVILSRDAVVTVAILMGVDFLESQLEALPRGAHARDRGEGVS